MIKTKHKTGSRTPTATTISTLAFSHPGNLDQGFADTGRSLQYSRHSNRIHPHLNSLQQHRQDTIALRDLWHQAKCTREASQYLEKKRQAWVKQYAEKVAPPFKPRASPVQEKPVSGRPRSLSASTTGPIQQNRILIARCRHDEDANLKPQKYYTAITQRLKPRETSPPFDALVREFVPLPKLFESSPVSRQYKMGSIEKWKKQVVKEVPMRPVFSVPANAPSPTGLPDYNEDYLISTRPAFYRADQNPSERHFNVNPEWLSEKIHFKTGKAYKTTLALG